MHARAATPATGTRAAPPVPFSRVRTSVAVGSVIGGGTLLVFVMGRPPAPTTLAIVTLLVQAALCFCVAATFRLPRHPSLTAVRAVSFFVVGALGALPAWFFEPNGVFTGLVVILLLL